MLGSNHGRAAARLVGSEDFSRKLRSKKTRRGKGSKPHDHLPVEEKESYRWLEAMANTKEAMGDIEIITVCDREADLYDFFKLSHQIGSPVLVRARFKGFCNFRG